MSAPEPAGMHLVAAWAASRGLALSPRGDEAWFRRFEPYDTMAAPEAYVGAVAIAMPPGFIVLAEPWLAMDDMEPLDRTVLGFATHPGLAGRASARAGEHFLTRVAFLDGRRPHEVLVGDPLWDAHVKTFAETEQDARAVFGPALRALLATWGFQGHIEVRPGALVIHAAGLGPTPEGYSRMRRIVIDVVQAALAR